MVDRRLVDEWLGKADEDFGFASINVDIRAWGTVMNSTYIGTATITPDGQLRLDETLGLPPGRVLVRVETLPQPPAARIHVLDLVEQNGPGRSREDIDAQIAALRDDWPE